MLQQDLRTLARAATARLAFDRYLRAGRFDPASADDVELKFNPNHDPANGRFTFGPGGSGSQERHSTTLSADPTKYYRGMTAKGVDTIVPVSGGYVDPSGHYVPETFPPDPYRLTDPVSALLHHIGGSGEARNYYLNSADTSQLGVSDFPQIQQIIDRGEPGTYAISDSPVQHFDAGRPLATHRLSARYTVGRLGLRTTGALVINPDGQYSFNGYLGVPKEINTYPASNDRASDQETATTIGRMLGGRDYRVYVIGTTPFSRIGRVPKRKHP